MLPGQKLVPTEVQLLEAKSGLEIGQEEDNRRPTKFGDEDEKFFLQNCINSSFSYLLPSTIKQLY